MKQPLVIYSYAVLALTITAKGFKGKKDLFENWLPLVDALRNQFPDPSKEMMDTILVVQNQVKDEFLNTPQR